MAVPVHGAQPLFSPAHANELRARPSWATSERAPRRHRRVLSLSPTGGTPVDSQPVPIKRSTFPTVAQGDQCGRPTRAAEVEQPRRAFPGLLLDHERSPPPIRDPEKAEPHPVPRGRRGRIHHGPLLMRRTGILLAPPRVSGLGGTGA